VFHGQKKGRRRFLSTLVPLSDKDDFQEKRDCENCIPKSNGALERRDWRAVKYFVKNQVDKRKRVLAPKNS